MLMEIIGESFDLIRFAKGSTGIDGNMAENEDFRLR
jgi:hypothetical protein